MPTVTTVRTTTIPGTAQGSQPVVKIATPKTASQTTGGIPQNVLGAYQTASLQGIRRPGNPPVAGAPQPPPSNIHPDGVVGVVGRAGSWCAGAAIGGSLAGPGGAAVGCAGGAVGSLLGDLFTWLDHDDPPAPAPATPPNPTPTPTPDGPTDAPSGPSCDGSDSDPSVDGDGGAGGAGGGDGGVCHIGDDLRHEQD